MPNWGISKAAANNGVPATEKPGLRLFRVGHQGKPSLKPCGIN